MYKPLINFIGKHSKDTDIFCFQEIFKTASNRKTFKKYRVNIYAELSKILLNHKGYFSPSLKDSLIMGRTEINRTNFNLYFGLSIFVKKETAVKKYGDFFLYGKRYGFNPKDLNSLPRNAQYINFTKNSKEYTVCNLHGIWLKEGKGDSSSRLEQSRKIKQFLSKKKGEKILCGDFNLDINTESIRILEEDMTNLVKKYDIGTTRNNLFPGKEKFADYLFISRKINVLSFEVPEVAVSDHLPLILEFL